MIDIISESMKNRSKRGATRRICEMKISNVCYQVVDISTYQETERKKSMNPAGMIKGNDNCVHTIEFSPLPSNISVKLLRDKSNFAIGYVTCWLWVTFGSYCTINSIQSFQIERNFFGCHILHKSCLRKMSEMNEKLKRFGEKSSHCCGVQFSSCSATKTVPIENAAFQIVQTQSLRVQYKSHNAMHSNNVANEFRSLSKWARAFSLVILYASLNSLWHFATVDIEWSE